MSNWSLSFNEDGRATINQEQYSPNAPTGSASDIGNIVGEDLVNRSDRQDTEIILQKNLKNKNSSERKLIKTGVEGGVDIVTTSLNDHFAAQSMKMQARDHNYLVQQLEEDPNNTQLQARVEQSKNELVWTAQAINQTPGVSGILIDGLKADAEYAAYAENEERFIAAGLDEEQRRELHVEVYQHADSHNQPITHSAYDFALENSESENAAQVRESEQSPSPRPDDLHEQYDNPQHTIYRDDHLLEEEGVVIVQETYVDNDGVIVTERWVEDANGNKLPMQDQMEYLEGEVTPGETQIGGGKVINRFPDIDPENFEFPGEPVPVEKKPGFLDWFFDWWEDFWADDAEIRQNFHDPKPSPLVLDLDGDGIELTALDGSSVYFDLNINGFAELTGWVSPDDALLALDVNGDGIINDGSELFGDQTGHDHGFLALDVNGINVNRMNTRAINLNAANDTQSPSIKPAA